MGLPMYYVMPSFKIFDPSLSQIFDPLKVHVYDIFNTPTGPHKQVLLLNKKINKMQILGETALNFYISYFKQ